jgi:hypothetical protein
MVALALLTVILTTASCTGMVGEHETRVPELHRKTRVKSIDFTKDLNYTARGMR